MCYGPAVRIVSEQHGFILHVHGEVLDELAVFIAKRKSTRPASIISSSVHRGINRGMVENVIANKSVHVLMRLE